MLKPIHPPDEATRLRVLRDFKILDTPPEERFDRITRLAQSVFNVPIAVVSLVDANRQWFKSCQGLPVTETPRDISFCGHAILSGSTFVINDALADERFADNPLVTSAPYIRFYAGHPLISPDGSRLGTLCIIDTAPRAFDQAARRQLADLAIMARDQILTNSMQQVLEQAYTNQASLRALFDGANYAIISTDPEGIIRSFNRAAERMLGYKMEEVVGQVSPAIIHDAAEIEARAAQLTQELGHPVAVGFEAFVAKAKIGLPDENEWTYIGKNGNRFPVLLSVTALRDTRGELTGYMGIAADISERKRVDRLKNEFVSTVSHELRTPLTSIRGALGLMVNGVSGALPEQAQALADIAYQNSARLLGLINDILDIEKVESGNMKFDFKVQSLMPLLEQALQENRSYAEQYAVSFHLTQSVQGSRVSVDAPRFMQIMSNLLSNAVKFSPAGATVSVSAQVMRSTVRVEISDQGPGIPVAFQSKIFEKFSQADSSDERQKGGTGLGLSISKAIVEKMGGRIGFANRAEGGAVFYFELPTVA